MNETISKTPLLDICLLPHLILGKLTVREILYFTIYHNLRHASQAGDYRQRRLVRVLLESGASQKNHIK